MARSQPDEAKKKSARLREEDKIDQQVEESFPASDPPSYSGGSVGAPGKRKPARKSANRLS